MFHDNPDAQTHFYLDNCGEKAHNPKYLTVRFVFDPAPEPNPGTPEHMHEIIKGLLKVKGLELDEQNNIHI